MKNRIFLLLIPVAIMLLEQWKINLEQSTTKDKVFKDNLDSQTRQAFNQTQNAG